MSLISTNNLVPLPTAQGLRDLLQSMAMLDAIICPEWEYRYYSFNSNWSKGEEMGSMRNGQGDDLFALFNSYGCFLKGFVHDSPAAEFGTDPLASYAECPPQFASCLAEPAFKTDDVTFCIWRSFDDSQWRQSRAVSPSDGEFDGSGDLLSPLDGNPETYWEWAESYYERDIALDAVKAIYERQRLTEEQVQLLNPALQLKHIQNDLREIGYPT